MIVTSIEDAPPASLHGEVRALTRTLTSALRAFGDLDTFLIYLALWQAHLEAEDRGCSIKPMSVHGLATGLGMAYETTRRKINLLAADGLVRRVKRGIVLPDSDPRADDLRLSVTDELLRLGGLREAGVQRRIA